MFADEFKVKVRESNEKGATNLIVGGRGEGHASESYCKSSSYQDASALSCTSLTHR